jgi:catechol 2,3-dioxygenase-like lactoylglutathione lyase family enzyme
VTDNLNARVVFFVSDIGRSARFYTDQLGFVLDWDSKDGVLQVSLFGFELILNQIWADAPARAGTGRVFIGLDDDQDDAFRKHLSAREMRPRRINWGRPTLAITDPDGNEMFFWLPRDDFTGIKFDEG